MIAAKNDFTAIGQLASQLRCTVRAIESAADRLGLEPALRLNQIVHYDGAQCEQIRESITKGK